MPLLRNANCALTFVAAIAIRYRDRYMRLKERRVALESRLGRSQMLQHLETRHDRDADVREQEIERLPQDLCQAYSTVIGNTDFISSVGQLLGDQGRSLTIVLNEEDFLASRLHVTKKRHPGDGRT
jgi:hypothetical protein